MLSIEECRELIPEGERLTEKEVAEIRKTLYGLAELALECYFKERVGTSSNEEKPE